MTQARWITEQDVNSSLSLEDALDALETGLARLGTPDAATVPKAMHAWDGGSVHALGAFDRVAGFTGFKSWINTKAGAVAIMTVYDVETGRLRAVIEAGALGAMRTAAATALATRELSEPGADEIAIIGSGRQALFQLAAIALVRPPRSVRFWSPTPEKRAAAAAAASRMFGIAALASDTLIDAIKDMPIIATVTRAKDPFLSLGLVAPGAHLNAIGAILPGFAELHDDVLPAADLLAADSAAAVHPLREIQDALAVDAALPSRMRDLSDLLAVPGTSRPASPRLTVFKSVGIGASDLALAAEVIGRAEAAGLGRLVDAPAPQMPRWRRTQ